MCMALIKNTGFLISQIFMYGTIHMYLCSVVLSTLTDDDLLQCLVLFPQGLTVEKRGPNVKKFYVLVAIISSFPKWPVMVLEHY